MAKILADLVTELQSEVPAVNSVPTSTQYEKAVKDAVLEFSRRCGLVKIAELSIVAGTHTYALASDFQNLITLESVSGANGVLISDAGLIPISADWEETYQIVNGQITFFPTPTYTMTREYRYKMAWVLTGSDPDETYAAMGDAEAQIVLIKAKALALEKRANAVSSSGAMQYSFGAVSVNKGGGVESMSTLMYKLHDEFVQECARYNGAVVA